MRTRNGQKTVPPARAGVSRGDDGVGADRIRARAFEIYRARCGANASGDEVSDWLQAERELRGAQAGSQVESKSVARGERLLAGGD